MMYSVLLKKDITEIIKTYKLFVVPAIFLVFGATSPVIAKFMPEFIKTMASEISIELPPPTWIDAFGQYLKNLSQIGMLAIILTTMGSIAEEKSKGIIHLILSRSVSRINLILSKYTATAILILISSIIGFTACSVGTYFLFQEIILSNVFISGFLFLIYTFFILSITIFASAIARSTTIAAAISIGGFVFFSILPSIHTVFAKYSPGALSNYSTITLSHIVSFDELLIPICVCVFLSISFLFAGNYIFSKQEI